MKILIIICIVLVSVNIILILDNSAQKSRSDSLEQQNQALTVYIESLQNQIQQIESSSESGREHSKDLKIRELLDSYLQDRNRQQVEIETTITTEELRADLEEYQKKQRFIPDIQPLAGEFAVSQVFSDRHKGIDLAAPLGTEVVAAAAGVIKSSYEDKYFGNVIIIDHLNNYLTFYAHLAKSFHEEGFFVEKGQTIGLVGSSGFSKSPHLHYEVIYRGDNIDPETVAVY